MPSSSIQHGFNTTHSNKRILELLRWSWKGLGDIQAGARTFVLCLYRGGRWIHFYRRYMGLEGTCWAAFIDFYLKHSSLRFCTAFLLWISFPAAEVPPHHHCCCEDPTQQFHLIQYLDHLLFVRLQDSGKQILIRRPDPLPRLCWIEFPQP